MTLHDPGRILSTILRHDTKLTSYKIALLRAINDVVLAFPDAASDGRDVAIPLRILADFWVAYYWPFVDPKRPVLQGRRFRRGCRLTEDIAFRPQLTALRHAWEASTGGGRPSDGFMEGQIFVCPWTERRIATPGQYAVDHLVPVSIYPINELWNLVPSDARFNKHVKRDRLPSPERLTRATPFFARAFAQYVASRELGVSLRQDVAVRFATIPATADYPQAVAHAVAGFIARIATARNLRQFD